MVRNRNTVRTLADRARSGLGARDEPVTATSLVHNDFRRSEWLRVRVSAPKQASASSVCVCIGSSPQTAFMSSFLLEQSAGVRGAAAFRSAMNRTSLCTWGRTWISRRSALVTTISRPPWTSYSTHAPDLELISIERLSDVHGFAVHRTRHSSRGQNSIPRRGHESHNPCTSNGHRRRRPCAHGRCGRGDAPTFATIADLGTFGARWTSGSAAAVNARGQVVGTNGTAAGKQHAFLRQNGTMRDLGTLGGRDSGASAINASGQVIGTNLTPKPQHVHAFIWKDGKMTDLGTLGGKSSRPRALNEPRTGRRGELYPERDGSRVPLAERHDGRPRHPGWLG